MPDEGAERSRRVTTGGGLVKRATVITPEQDAEIDRIAAEELTTGTAVMRSLIDDGLRLRRLRRERDAAAIEAAV